MPERNTNPRPVAVRPSESKNFPGQLTNTWSRRERTVIGASDRRQNKTDLTASSAREVRQYAENQEKYKNHIALYKSDRISDNTANALRTKFHAEEKEHGSPLTKSAAKFTNGFRNTLPTGLAEGTRQSGVQVKSTGKSMHERLPALPQAIVKGTPEFTEPLAPATRLGRTKYVDTNEITHPDEKSALYQDPGIGFQRPDINKVDVYAEREKQHSRYQHKLERRRLNEDRVLEAYEREEKAKVLAQDNRALRYTHQRLAYLERIASADEYFTHKNNKNMEEATRKEASASARLNATYPKLQAPWGTDNS